MIQFFYGMGLLILLTSFLVAWGDDCSSQWELFSSEPYVQRAFPDTNVAYWRYRFALPVPNTTAFRITGDFPKARYINFNVYDQKTMDSTGSVPDVKLPRSADNPNQYTLWIGKNGLAFPKPIAGVTRQYLEIWYRIYLPEKDNQGGIPLPKVTAFDTRTGQETSCPKRETHWAPFTLAYQNLPPAPTSEKIEFYAPTAQALYANLDNQYLAARLPYFSKGVAIVKLRPPTGHVRYWSFCMGGIGTRTSSCIYDTQFHPRRDGSIALVVGPPSIEKEVREHGLDFLPHGWFFIPLLIYRNLLTQPDFIADIGKMPKWSRARGTREIASLTADSYLGDYAPSGTHCSTATFLSDLHAHSYELCGLKLSSATSSAHR